MADPRCKDCSRDDLGYCAVHEQCDDLNCQALQNPTTIEECQIALEHWRDHSYLSGCSHGQ